MLTTLKETLQNTTSSKYYPSGEQGSLRSSTYLTVLTVICSGGLLLLVNMGPGQVSFDEKKKVY